MYLIRKSGYSKRDAVQRWCLPDRIFFACGACHILAYAFMERYRPPGAKILWLKPAAGFTGNHIVVATASWVFDYHGYSGRDRYFAHTFRKARHWWPGWEAEILELPPQVLVSEQQSQKHEGLWLREPKQFLHDAMPRARRFWTGSRPLLPGNGITRLRATRLPREPAASVSFLCRSLRRTPSFDRRCPPRDGRE